MQKCDVVVTRHPALIELLRELGLASLDTKVLTHVSSPSEIEGKVVAGVLPIWLASYAKEIWEVKLNLRPEDRGRELSLNDLKERFVGVFRYKVQNLGQIV